MTEEREIEAAAGNQPAIQAAVYKAIQARLALARSTHGALCSAYGQSFTQIKQILDDYWRESAPYIDSINDPILQDYHQLCRKWLIWMTLVAFREPVSFPASLHYTTPTLHLHYAYTTFANSMKKSKR